MYFLNKRYIFLPKFCKSKILPIYCRIFSGILITFELAFKEICQNCQFIEYFFEIMIKFYSNHINKILPFIKCAKIADYTRYEMILYLTSVVKKPAIFAHFLNRSIDL